jgi:hypothetical protein
MITRSVPGPVEDDHEEEDKEEEEEDGPYSHHHTPRTLPDERDMSRRR